jgi:hypothetical protein
VWPLGKAPRLGVVLKLLLVCNNATSGLRFENYGL